MAGKWPTTATDADLYIAVNELQNNLSGAVTNVQTTLPLNSATSFPTVGLVLIDNEVIKYTGISTNTLTGCTRAFDGTTAAAHSSSAVVSFAVMAAHHNVLKDELEAIEADLAGVLLAITGATPGSTATSILNRMAQITQQVKNITGTTNWYDAISTPLNGMLPLAGGTLTGNLILSKAAGDASFVINAPTGSNSLFDLRLNNSASTNWQIIHNSDDHFSIWRGSDRLTISTAGAVAIQGTATNDNAAAGFVGEAIRSAVANVSVGTTATWADMTSIVFATGGDYEITGIFVAQPNGATVTLAEFGITTTAGNSTAGLAFGDNYMGAATPSGASNLAATIANYRLSVAAGTTVYLKAFLNYTVAVPKFWGRISARRFR